MTDGGEQDPAPRPRAGPGLPDPEHQRAGRSRSTGRGPTRRSRARTCRRVAAELVPVPGASFAELPVDRISPNAAQPRQVFDDEAMAELVHSIREIGLLQPVVVRPAGHRPGRRRPLRAGDGGAALAGHPGRRARVIPAIVRETDDTDMLRDALLENLHRVPAQPAWRRRRPTPSCSRTSGAPTRSWPHRIGRSRPQISNTIRLLRLSPAVQRRVAAGVLSAGHARSLLAVEDPELQDRLAQRVVAEGISVRGLEEIVAVGVDAGPETRRTPARQADRARPGRARRPALGPVRDPGQGRPRPGQGQDHRRVRQPRRPAPDRRHHGSAQTDTLASSAPDHDDARSARRLRRRRAPRPIARRARFARKLAALASGCKPLTCGNSECRQSDKRLAISR